MYSSELAITNMKNVSGSKEDIEGLHDSIRQKVNLKFWWFED